MKRAKTNETRSQRNHGQSNLGRVTKEEYDAMWNNDRSGRNLQRLRRLTYEEYCAMCTDEQRLTREEFEKLSIVKK